jgi:hypothetical protein
MGKFASETTVSVERSEAEIKATLRRYGAVGFGVWEEPERAIIQFDCQQRRIRFVLPFPNRDDSQFQKTPGKGLKRTSTAALAEWEKACRQRWRALLLAIKAKLEAVDCGIAEFESEFLAYVVDPSTNRTIGERVVPEVQAVYLEHAERLKGLPGPHA